MNCPTYDGSTYGLNRESSSLRKLDHVVCYGDVRQTRLDASIINGGLMLGISSPLDSIEPALDFEENEVDVQD